ARPGLASQSLPALAGRGLDRSPARAPHGAPRRSLSGYPASSGSDCQPGDGIASGVNSSSLGIRIVPRRTCAVKELPTLHRRARRPELGHLPRWPTVLLALLHSVFRLLLDAPRRLGPQAAGPNWLQLPGHGCAAL